jgi:hypothetical protein
MTLGRETKGAGQATMAAVRAAEHKNGGNGKVGSECQPIVRQQKE